MLSAWAQAVRIWGDYCIARGFYRPWVEEQVERVYMDAWFNPDALVGHLRVAVTDEEHAAMPGGIAVDDAGETGPERARTR